MYIKGRWKLQHYREGKLIAEEKFPNQVKNQGLNRLLDIGFRGQFSSWFVGLIADEDFTSVDETDAYLQLQADALNWRELHPNNYDSLANVNRKSISFDAAASGRIVNEITPVQFPITANGTGKLVRGIFLTTTSSKNNNDGHLFSTALFNTPKEINEGDILQLVYEILLSRGT